MKNRIGVVRLLLQSLDGLECRENEQLDLASFCLPPHFFHHRQSCVRASTHHQALALPGNFLLDGERGVSKLVAKFLGWLFLALADLTAVDDHVSLVRAAVNLERAKGKLLEQHIRLLPGPQRFWASLQGLRTSSPGS